jgi:CBS domain containing-hemolysin-like protein
MICLLTKLDTVFVTEGRNTTSEVGISDAYRTMGKGMLHQGWKNIPVHIQGVCYVLLSSLQVTSFFGCLFPVGQQELARSFAYSHDKQVGIPVSRLQEITQWAVWFLVYTADNTLHLQSFVNCRYPDGIVE